MYRFKYKEDEENPLPIPPSGSRWITVMETGITTLCREGISVDDDNNPTPDNVMQSYDVLPTPSSLTIDVEPQSYFWHQSGW